MAESKFTQEVLDDIFSYHPPNDEQRVNYENIRNAAKVFAQSIINNTPASVDQTVAIRKIREAVMIANASIALEGKY